MFKTFFRTIPLFCVFMSSIAYADINVAVIAPKAGEYKNLGNELIVGVQIAVDDINSRGGLNGERLNLITVDDQCDDRLAVSTAQMMAVNVSKKDKMSLVIGPYCSNSFNEVAAIYAKANIFQIIPTSVTSSEAKSSHKGLVKMVGYADNQSEDFFKYYSSNFTDKKVALIYDSEIKDVVDAAASIQSVFLKNNKLDKIQTFNFANYEDLDAMATDIISHDIEISYVLGRAKKIAKVSKALKSDKKDFVIFTNKYLSNGEYNKVLGKLAEGSYFVALPSLKNNPSFTENLVKLRLLGVEPEGLMVYSYSAMKLWEDLVEKSDSFTYNKLAKTLSENKVDTGWGEMVFNNGNPQESINYGIYKLQAGEYTQVY